MSRFEHPNQVGGYEHELPEGWDSMRVLFWVFCVYDNRRPYCSAGAPVLPLVQSSCQLAVSDVRSITTYNHPSPIAQCGLIKLLVPCHPGVRSLHKAVRIPVTFTLELTLQLLDISAMQLSVRDCIIVTTPFPLGGSSALVWALCKLF